MIRAENIDCITTAKGVSTELKPLNFHIEKGEFATMQCSNGLVNATLLKTIGLLLPLQNGRLFINDTLVSELSANSQIEFRKNNIGFLFAEPFLIDELSVFENVELPLTYLGVGRRERKERVEIVLAQLYLSHRKEFLPSQLSKELRYHVALARAFVNQPQLLLVDKPKGHSNTDELMKMLQEINEQQTTILMTTTVDEHIAYAQKYINVKPLVPAF